MTEDKSPDGIRLNKYVALRTGMSRREADEYIEKGRVTVNGQPSSLGLRIQPGDSVKLDNKLLTETEFVYIAFHKPIGYVSSRRAQGDTPTLYNLLPKEYHTLKTVGRLDKDSSGILLLTNDGDFAHRMTHPKFSKIKQYEVTLSNELAPLHQQMINDFGVQLEDGTSKLTLERLSETNRREWRIIMSEGRNRQIRRTFAALGYTVTKLHRTHFGDYSLNNLEPGEYITITKP